MNRIETEKISSKCPECNGHIIIQAHEMICESCGLIIEDTEFYFSYQFNETKNSDLNSADQYISIGKTVDNVCALGSHIDHFNSKIFYDYKHNLIQSSQQKLYKKLKTFYSLQLKIKDHETDYRILKILNKIVQYFALSNNVKLRAAYFYQKIKNRANSIRNHVSLIGFCIFYASREYSQNAPISIREICKAFEYMGHRINPKLIIRDSIEYQKYINIKNIPHKSEDFINRFVNSIVNSNSIIKRMKNKESKWTIDEFRIRLTQKSNQILNFMNSKIRGARNPFILAAAIVYCADKMLARENGTKSILTQKTASDAMQVAEYSIRDHYVKILKPFFSL